MISPTGHFLGKSRVVSSLNIKKKNRAKRNGKMGENCRLYLAVWSCFDFEFLSIKFKNAAAGRHIVNHGGHSNKQ